MQASETTILPSMRPIGMRIARANVSRPGPGAKTEWKVPHGDGAGGRGEHRPHRERRVVRRVDVHDVDPQAAEQPAQPLCA